MGNLQPVTHALSRNDWIGICSVLLVVGGLAVWALWKALNNETKRAVEMSEVVKRNTEAAQASAKAMENLCQQISNTTEQNQQSQLKMMDAFLAQSRKNRRKR